MFNIFRSSKCVNESHFFLVFSGIFAGICLWRNWHLKNRNLLIFESVLQTGNITLRRRFAGIVRECLWEAILNMRWFLIFYVLFGMLRIDINMRLCSKINGCLIRTQFRAPVRTNFQFGFPLEVELIFILFLAQSPNTGCIHFAQYSGHSGVVLRQYPSLLQSHETISIRNRRKQTTIGHFARGASN